MIAIAQMLIVLRRLRRRYGPLCIWLILYEGQELVADDRIKDCYCLNFCCAAEIGSKVSELGKM